MKFLKIEMISEELMLHFFKPSIISLFNNPCRSIVNVTHDVTVMTPSDDMYDPSNTRLKKH